MSNQKNKFNFIRDTNNYNKSWYQPEHKLYKFYQICMYKDPKYDKYNIRLLIIDENQDIIKETIKRYTLQQCNNIIASSKTNEYNVYPTYDLNLVGYPNLDELLKTQSELLR